MKISSLILAAGSSSRLGSPKQLVEYKGEILVSKITQLALAITDNVLIVLGANENIIQPKLTELVQENQQKLKVIVNTDWNEGIGNSISFGVKQLFDTSDAILILLCDQPFVGSLLLQKMMQAFANTEYSIIACKYANQLGVPILFGKKYFLELMSLNGDLGAKVLLKQYGGSVMSIDFPEGIYDIDTQEDLAKFLLNE
ncbi:NTP transferase domain-containing protein [Arcicella rosea]|uniref:Molybdenum cofactor cytidylyltransferase n=1 Tax=Arcicella rosea TaxID=502909 RepID=A0A841EPM3_9BACT|nr:nucleotidyltransferase family protein [Arcicella rosea]MBB6002973.1 molybdenum cofactor cytidylyltransferase [Arcicella rosea]